MSHFEGKDVLSHLREAKQKGKSASSEIHGTELPGHISAFGDTCRETSLLLMILSLLFQPSLLFFPFLASFLLWKVGRSALLGYSRLERLHRLIEEERWEIEHHRSQEKEELTAIYQAKGLSGKLLHDCIDVLMADDNRLLQVMLEEELFLGLENFEHPLKQAFGALLGVLLPTLLFLLIFVFSPLWTLFPLLFLLIAIVSVFTSHLEKNNRLSSLIWNLAVALLSIGAAHFIKQIL